MTLPDLLAKPVWSKEIVAYVGNASSVEVALHALRVVQLDLLELCPVDDEWPNRVEDRAEVLSARLEERLKRERDNAQTRTVFWVCNAALLARYCVGLRPFYDWLGGGRTFTVLHIERIREPDHRLLESQSLICDRRRLLDYFRNQLQSQDRVIVEAA